MSVKWKATQNKVAQRRMIWKKWPPFFIISVFRQMHLIRSKIKSILRQNIEQNNKECLEAQNCLIMYLSKNWNVKCTHEGANFSQTVEKTNEYTNKIIIFTVCNFPLPNNTVNF